MIKIRLTEKEMEELLQQYYLEYEEISATVHFYLETVYEGIYEIKSLAPRMSVKHKMNIMGREREVEETKTEKDIVACLNKALAKDGYSLHSIKGYQDTDRGITSSSIELDVNQISKDKPKVYEKK